MQRVLPQTTELDAVGTIWRCIERRLAIALALLLLSIFGILGLTVGQPAVQYMFGSGMQMSAIVEGAGCGAHLDWDVPSRTIDAGTRVTIENDTVYWRIPVAIERQVSGDQYVVVAESPQLSGGETWDYTFWRGGEYRISSADETQRIAGLETVISVK
jgi:hypothetical protein